MPVTAPVRHLTEAGYLDFERTAEVKHQLFDDELLASDEFTPGARATSRFGGVPTLEKPRMDTNSHEWTALEPVADAPSDSSPFGSIRG